MGLVRLAICISGVYGAFLLWAIAQERLSSPFPSLHPHSNPEGDKFPNPLFFNYAQALASSLASACYLLFKSYPSLSRHSENDKPLSEILGLDQLLGSSKKTIVPIANGNKVEVKDKTKTKEEAKMNGSSAEIDKNWDLAMEKKKKDLATEEKKKVWFKTLPALLLQVSLFQTIAGPIGFQSLRHISYPTMVLGKSCKLIPVLILNVVLYRRRFSTHKYIVVALVTVGISMFMLLADNSGTKKKRGGDSIYGLTLLLINLLIDGLTNSTQDQIFSLYPTYSGQQMMFIMALMTQLVLLPMMIIPLPTHPISCLTYLLQFLPAPILSFLPLQLTTSHASFSPTFSAPTFLTCIQFIISHPTSLAPLLAYALLGGMGQLFIFETIQHFGSLTLVMITVTRKLFTMLLSVFLFEHRLTWGQWVGVAVVFGGIGVEAGIKRRDMVRRARRDKK